MSKRSLILASVAMGGIALVSASAAHAAPLGEGVCKQLRADRDQLLKIGVADAMAGGPQAVAQLQPARQKAVRRYIQVEEMLLFRCPRFLPATKPSEKKQDGDKRQSDIVGASAAGGVQKSKPSKAAARRKQALVVLRARFAGERAGAVRRSNHSDPLSHTRRYQDETQSKWDKRFAAFERGDPRGALAPLPPRRSPLQSKRRVPRVQRGSVPPLPRRAPIGLPDVSAPIRDGRLKKPRPAKRASVPARPSKARQNSTASVNPAGLRGSLSLGLPPNRVESFDRGAAFRDN